MFVDMLFTVSTQFWFCTTDTKENKTDVFGKWKLIVY